MNADFEAFKEYASWFIKKSDKVEFLDIKIVPLTLKFRKTFPCLASLIDASTILNLKINDQQYRLYSWTNKDNLSCGWLSKIECTENIKLNLIEEHLLLLSEIGGIQEFYNPPEGSLCENQNFVFMGSKCICGIGASIDYYQELCFEENKKPINCSDFICFSEEANGNLTLYDPHTKAVLLFAPDHCFDNVSFIENQPEFTFHTFDNIINFIDYVEAFASQWVDKIEITFQKEK
ncbi:hypothetical protein QJU23_04660 [Pasteurella atlantica]|uniref:Uncharacterized protein n=2 Tax=Pasteurellaceae TaxID=712 RepID=A0ACC6HLH2_9PAST|nr:hypothetical protein [Pasteurella atlantica]MDP8051715.1 hypothetical protein [Pasteurella atlantica]MDP8104962.1 hypothetical protein [Pasteurella atlantica]MDP8148373.1 hypothetical protein [Pasteurella atlantica]